MFSKAQIPVIHGSTNQFTGYMSTGVVNGYDLFSDVVKDPKFNYGLDAFDVVVQQWDNFGKNLDKTGDMIQTLELTIGSYQRFKMSGFYTSNVPQMNFFDGKSPLGINVYTFCVDPSNIQASGALNFTRAQTKLTLNADYDVNDVFFSSLMVYNVMEYREQTVQVLYATSFPQ